MELTSLRPRMTSVALRIASTRDAADDIVQNAYEKAVRNLHQFDGRARFSTWLHRIVVNESLMWVRAERRHKIRRAPFEPCDTPEWHAEQSGPDHELEARRNSERLHALVSDLPAPEREVIQRCSLGGMSYDELGRILGLEPSALKSRAYRARRHLATLWSGA